MNIPEVIKEVCCGNAAAQEFCTAFYDFSQAFDDLVDRDKPVAQRDACSAVLRFLQALAFNSFFNLHKTTLFTLLHSGVASYVFSNDLLAKEDTKSRVIGEVLKSEYQTVFFYVAFLCGGFQHQLAMQDKYRQFDFG